MAGLRGLTTPIKIVSAVIFVLFGLTTFFAGHSFNSLISGNEDAQEEIARTCTVTCTKISPDVAIGSGAAVTLGSGAVGTLY